MPYKDRRAQKKYFQDYYEKNKIQARIRNLKNKYNLTPEEYNKFLESQDFSCALCFRHVSELSRPLFIDHDHDSGLVRGLLCLGCNAGLGMLGDNIEGLQRAVKYLKGDL